MADGTRITLLKSGSGYGDAGHVLVVSSVVAQSLIGAGWATLHVDQSGTGSTAAAKIDTNHRTVQAQVFVKAGFMDISNESHAEFAKPANAPANWQPSMVSIRMKDGRVLPVHFEVALQRVLQGVATLV